MFRSIVTASDDNLKEKISHFQLIWHMINLAIWALIYVSFLLFTNENNTLYFFLAFLICLIGLGLVQEFLINKIIRVFPVWFFTYFIGLIFGFIWLGLLVVSLILLAVGSGAFATSLSDVVGYNISSIIAIIVIPVATAADFIFFTYVVWNKVVKPLHASDRLNDKGKFILEGIITFSVSLFVSLPLVAALYIFFNRNMFIASFVGAVTFSLISYSGFKEIYAQNSFFKAFRPKT